MTCSSSWFNFTYWLIAIFAVVTLGTVLLNQQRNLKQKRHNPYNSSVI